MTEDEELFDDEFEDDEELEDDEERATGAGFDLICFFHTGSSMTISVPYQVSAREVRRTLTDLERETYGSVMLINGVQVVPEDEEEWYLSPGDVVVFSGSVKGG